MNFCITNILHTHINENYIDAYRKEEKQKKRTEGGENDTISRPFSEPCIRMLIAGSTIIQNFSSVL